MKIGALRRIDNLGRIVIPKSVRKVMKIKNGDNLQVFTEEENIIIKKYSELEKLKNIPKILKQTLEDIIKKEVYITDREKIIIPSKKNDYSKEKIIELIESRKITINKNIIEKKSNKKDIITTIPIIVSGDIYGTVIILSNDLLTKEEISTAKTIIKLIEKILED